MRDGIAFERHGIPTVVLAQDRFFPAAKAQAELLQLPDLNLVVVEQSRPWHTDEQRRQEVEKIRSQVVEGLKARPGVRVEPVR